MRTLIVLAAILVLVLILHTFWRSSPGLGKQFLNRILIGAAVVLFLFLLATGRMPWLLALFAAALPLYKRIIPLIRYIPLLKNLYSRYQNSSKQTGASTGRYSSVRTQFFDMRLDHDTGAMDGQILYGKLAGSQLHELDLTKLLELYQEVSVDDESLALLQTYLDRNHPDWKNQADYTQSNSSTNQTKGGMSIAEAREILGVTETATQQEIIAAHRKLMQKVHPDHGGSTYLAAKINIAKNRLINQG